MRRITLFLASAGFLLALTTPLIAMGSAQAVALDQSAALRCRQVVEDGEFPSITTTTDGCDLAVDKQVSINGGSYVEADTSGDAAMAAVGDPVTYKITVTNTSSDPSTMTPQGIVTVHDLLPNGVTFGSATVSAGSYSANTGDWALPLTDQSGTTLPATLTINTTIDVTGLVQNNAAFSNYNPCLDGCGFPGNLGFYSDANPSNNSNDAWVDPQTKPQVLAASTTATSPNTGFGTPVNGNSLALLLVSFGLVGLAASLIVRKQKV